MSITLDTSVLEILHTLPATDGGSFADELVDIFLEDVRVTFATMSVDASENNLAGLKDAAHRLKTSSAQVGGVRFSKLNIALETAASEGNLPRCHQLVSDMAAELDALVAALSKALNRALSD